MLQISDDKRELPGIFALTTHCDNFHGIELQKTLSGVQQWNHIIDQTSRFASKLRCDGRRNTLYHRIATLQERPQRIEWFSIEERLQKVVHELSVIIELSRVFQELSYELRTSWLSHHIA
jgi:hypothetical protein